MSGRLQPEYLLIGEILRPHGIRGELRMRILTDFPERISTLETIFLGNRPDANAPRAYRVAHMRMHKEYGLLKLREIDNRTEAEALRGLFALVHLNDAVPLEDDEIYTYQLIGLPVRTEDGHGLGAIDSILETGANDVYIIKGGPYGEILFPVTDETVIETNIDDGYVLVRPPEGLIPNL